MSLRPTRKNNPKRDLRSAGKSDTKSTELQKDDEKKKKAKNDERKPQSFHCHNCNTMGHLAADCKQPKRKKGSCFKCNEMGHISKLSKGDLVDTSNSNQRIKRSDLLNFRV